MIEVLLIEDDPMVRQVNTQFLQQIEGISIVGVAGNGIEGMEQIHKLQPDLVLMDLFMPKQDGIETLRQIREAGLSIDVITVTAANDMKTIEKILQLGAYDYIMKPFTFDRMKQTIDRYMQFKSVLKKKDELSQNELDALIHPTRVQGHYRDALPKGLNGATLDKIIKWIGEQGELVTAVEVASGVGMARVTARRYLDYLEKQNQVEIDIQYGGVGRPVNKYHLLKK
ncbi:response regulator [Kurthia zopfii]|uniref:response regulator n=1 Tax=Kurthia zopfii TaxID=1650 RepID=UPI000F6B9D78|nr:response regulator [Kurthia zopfii]VEI07067.1 Destabilizer of plasmid inheritance [Kurthia zopfii]